MVYLYNVYYELYSVYYGLYSYIVYNVDCKVYIVYVIAIYCIM